MKNLYCIICGMKINERNYSFNSEGIINKNDGDRIVTCPFCGVGFEYLKQEAYKYINKVNNLDNVTLKILDHAMKLEVFNGEFYEEASNIAKDLHNKNMFNALSRIEFMHARIHQRLGNFDKLPVLQKIDYSRFISDSQLLTEAKKREEHAISFYSKYMKLLCDNRIEAIFSALSVVEKEHIELTFV